MFWAVTILLAITYIMWQIHKKGAARFGAEVTYHAQEACEVTSAVAKVAADKIHDGAIEDAVRTVVVKTDQVTTTARVVGAHTVARVKHEGKKRGGAFAEGVRAERAKIQAERHRAARVAASQKKREN